MLKYQTVNIVHQIVEVRSNGVITKGINNEIIDPDFIPFDEGLVKWEDIIGLVVAVIY